jgi:PIN domain nuclease of toxin-antitoxin system
MSRVVLDSSAVLAVLNGEAGAEKLSAELLSTAICSTVNLAEVHGKLVSRGLSEYDAWTAAVYTIHSAVDFTTEQARIAGRLISDTRAFGLSLGDRACLALGIHLRVPVYTADRSWKNLKLPVRIHVIR